MPTPEDKPNQQSAEQFYLTTPIYYVNARPHLGHAYSTIVCDAIARRKRAQGIDTWFLTGTDEHGQKIERSAKLAGRSPEEFAAIIAGEFRALWDRMGLAYDDFLRTTEPRHKRGVQKLFALLRDRGFLYKGGYTGQYCVSDETYVDLPPGSPCPDCGRMTETVSEENYFFKLSAFERKLLEHYEAHPEFIQPESSRKEILAFVRGGLKDLSVSRTSFSWGIPVPYKEAGDEKHVIYVWMDALANYMTALGYGSDDPADQARFAKFWPANIHLIGKEIARFHAVYWPAFLMAAGLPLPQAIVANGWLLFEQSKMSKSRGNIVRAETILEVLGADALRYFLLREVSFGHDGSFSFDALVQRYNGDLANGYGNLVSRVVNMIHKYFGGVVPDADKKILNGTIDVLDPDRQDLPRSTVGLIDLSRDYGREAQELFDQRDFSRSLERIWAFIGSVDNYLTTNAPWKKPVDRSDTDHLTFQANVLYTAAEAIRMITGWLYPFIPESAGKVWRQLGLGDMEEAAKRGGLKQLEWGGLLPGTQLGAPAPLFPRAEKDAIERMQNLEEQNTKNAVAAASAASGKAAADAEPVQLNIAPSPVPLAADGAGSAPAGNAVMEPTTSGLEPASSTLPAPTVAPALVASPIPPAALPAAAPGPEAADGVVEEKQFIAIDDFLKVELRVAQILVAERIPKADKLLRLEVDLGYEKRQILAGIAQYYEPEKLIGRKIVIVANLAPRKMRGLESNGMLLAASLEDSSPVLAGFLEDVPLGARLK